MKIIFEDKNKLKIENLIELIHQETNIDNLCNLIYKLSELTNGFPCCKICGKPLVFQKMRFFIKENELIITCPTSNSFTHIYNEYKFKLEKCYLCIKDHFRDNMPSAQKYLFQLRYKWAKFIYDIPEEVHKLIRSDKCGVTLKSLTNKWGEEEGEKRWKQYCNKQAETNKFEYKSQKYGWTKEIFDEFNKSRACTLQNLINRYGEKIGNKKWENYIKRQKETKSWDYLVNKYGEERAKEINKSHAVTLESMIKKYGEDEGNERYLSWVNTSQRDSKYYSNSSQILFNQIVEILGSKYTYRYATHNGEHIVINKLKNVVYFLDFYIPELKLAIEFDGDVWHANPSKYSENDIPITWGDKLTAKEIWENDKNKQKFVESLGIKVIRIWESEFNDKNFDIHKFINEKIQIEI